MNIRFKIKKITVLVESLGTDTILITLDEPTPYPEMKYDGNAKIEVAAGYGIEWCKKVLGVSNPEIISMKTGLKQTFQENP